MDEDDSQDELINRSSKGKRAAAWAISDNSDEAGSDEEAESESGEDDEDEEHLDEDEEHLDEEDDEDEEDEEEEDDESKPEEEGACAGTSADAEVSSDEEAEKCPICLHSFSRQPVATPENCEHYFCLDCILEWSKNANSCPIDRKNFKLIYLRTCFGGKVKKEITIQKPAKQCEQDTIDVNLEETSCEVCGGSDREDRLLLCDGCDAGYHMECLTPPLDAVPVEEWFCPECEASNRQSRGSAAETSDTDSLPSTARTASSRSRSHTGQTRAIARTQHSERVRANVNRHRITQARAQELAPTYLIRSTWLDETINAVVAGLNSAVYVRDLTSRPSTTRRRKSRKAKGRKISSKSKKGKAASTGIKRRKRRVRRTKSRKKLVTKKTPTPRSRIASSLGIVKDKKSSSLPTVYRPSESTLSSMRADIGAASLSIYGDPFDLDPFTDREDDEQEDHDTVLLEAKRRGISRSAFRSHQPVARPVSLSRRSVSVPQVSAVAEAAPVPDLLGSILSGQSMLLMDSSDVIINRDGSLKATKPMSFTNAIRPGSRSQSSSSGDGGPQVSPGPLLDHMDRLGSSDSSLNRHFLNGSSPLSPPLGSTFTPSEMSHSLVVPRGNPTLLGTFSHDLNGPNQRVGLPITNGVRESRQSCTIDSSKSKSSSQSHSVKGPTKPMWMDVSVLPRIPKIKRENSSDDVAKTDGNANKTNGSSSGSSSAHNYGIPDIINRLAGDKERGHSVDQQHGRTAGPRNRPDGASGSSGFSSSFSSSAAASHTNHQRFSSGSSSSSSSVSFRISSSGNSWHSRRLNIASLTPSGSSLQENCTEEEKKRQLHRDKQKLLASRSKDSNNIYDPFNPTESDSGSSDGESGGVNVEGSSRLKQEPVKFKNKVLSKSRWDLKQVKVEAQSPPLQEKPVTTAAQETLTQQQKGNKVNTPFRKSRFSHIERPSPFNTFIKKESESDTDEEVKKALHSETEDASQTNQHIKAEKTVKPVPTPEPSAAPCDRDTSATSTSSSVRKITSSPSRKSSSSPNMLSTSSPARKSTSSPVGKSISSPVGKSNSSRVWKSFSSPPRKSTSSPVRKSSSSPNRKSTSSPVRKSTSSPVRKSTSSPVRKSTSSPVRKSTSSPVRKSTSSPVRKSTSSPVRKSTTSPVRKSTSSPVRKSTSSPVRKSTSSPVRKSTSSPVRKSTSSPVRKSTSSPSRKSSSSPTKKCISSPSRTSNSSPVRKSTSSPSRKSNSSPVWKSTSSPSRKSNLSPVRKSTSSPTRKSTSSPTRKSTSSPTRKSTSSPTRKSTSSPTRKSTSSPARKSTSSPARKSTISPARKSTTSPARKSTSSPARKSTSSPARKSTTSPTRKSVSSPVRKSTSSPTRKPASSPVRRLEKKSESFKNQSKDSSSEKHTSNKNSSSKDQRARSSSTERPRKTSSPDRDRKHGHAESKYGASQKEKDKAKSSRRSRSKERRRTHRDSDSSHSKSPDRTSKKRRRSRSRSKDRRRSRSCSSSSSRERSRTKRHKRQSRERNEDNEVKRRSAKDKRRDRSCSKSRSKSRSRSRERRRARSLSKSRSRSRSRSREKRKTESRRQQSREEIESRSKDKKRQRSRSNSREKKKEKSATKTQKMSENNSYSVKDKKPSKDKKDDCSSVKTERASKTNKPGSTSCTSSSVLKKEPVESKAEAKPTEAAVKNDKTKKEIKEKCTALDMFEESPTCTPVKTEELDIPIVYSETQIIKTDACESEKLSTASPEKKVDVSDSPNISVHLPTVSTPPQDIEEQSTELPIISIKQEPLPQSSDSDDDFNVDVMLDNLDLVKSRLEEPTEATVKEEKSEGETAAAGVKSKTQVKRVTWNIEEPVGPQPEKSASKVALYKLKLKQEGIRRPSAAATVSQDLTGTASAGDVTKASIDPERSSGSDISHALSASTQGQTDDGDLLKKDKTYLKKLHMQERAIEEVKLAIKPFYQKRDINKDEYKDILRKAVQKVCHSKSGEINPVKVGNLVKAYVDKYKHARKYKKGDEPDKSQELLKPSDSP